MFRSVFLVISEIAVSNALYRRFAQTRITAKAEEASDRAVSHATGRHDRIQLRYRNSLQAATERGDLVSFRSER
jgi:hypothetical protein